MTEEREMTDKVILSLPKPMGDTFIYNILNFYKLRQKEIQIRSDIVFKNISLIPHLEKYDETNLEYEQKLFEIFDEIPEQLQFNKKTFFESLHDPKTILVTLRFASEDGKIIGFAKGGPLENYSLIRSIKDENHGKFNTVFLEPLALEMGYWGHGGGSSLRKVFNDAVKKQGYSYVTSLQLRDVIQNRIDRHENIEFVQQLNPERLDYYRVTL
ncbi:MAG: GNAT family N-acetyltransferase [Nitrosopumilus sp.]|nr:GNAT family N-acetyltransferase [Nitrosopumilus sp.]